MKWISFFLTRFAACTFCLIYLKTIFTKSDQTTGEGSCLSIKRTQILLIIKYSHEIQNKVYQVDLHLLKGRQRTKGSPVMSLGQLHTAVVPSRTLQLAPAPQTPAQGFTHFEYKHDGRSDGQSPWDKHSARQDTYGSPRYP